MKIGLMQGILQRGIGYQMWQNLTAGVGRASVPAKPLGTKWVLPSVQSGKEKAGPSSLKTGILA